MNRTFWRVYLHGLLLLVVVGLAIFAVASAFGRPYRKSPERFGAWLAAGQEMHLHDPQALQREIEGLHETLGNDMAVYDLEGTRIAAAGEAPPELPPRALRRKRAFHMRSPDLVAAPIGRPPQAWLVVRPPRFAGDLTRPLAILGAVLVALAIGSIPLARSIVSPLERLTRTVRRFGGGDLTARTGVRQGRGEVEQLAFAFDEMAERIERLVRGEKELLANVSHELRTPLTRIRIALELAEEGGHAGRNYLREIETDLAELEQMIADVLTTARLDLAAGTPSGTPPLRIAEHPVEAIVDGAAERFRALHPDRVLEVAKGGVLPVLPCDESLMRRALANLLDNAAKYSEGAIALRARGEPDLVAIEVVDQGIGIEHADLPRLFTPFFRTDRSRARGTGGVGLGLALTRRIVEAHGGAISVSSEPGKGTTFRIDLGAREDGARVAG